MTEAILADIYLLPTTEWGRPRLHARKHVVRETDRVKEDRLKVDRDAATALDKITSAWGWGKSSCR